MKTTTKFAIGSVAVVALSAGVAGVTAGRLCADIREMKIWDSIRLII